MPRPLPNHGELQLSNDDMHVANAIVDLQKAIDPIHAVKACLPSLI